MLLLAGIAIVLLIIDSNNCNRLTIRFTLSLRRFNEVELAKMMGSVEGQTFAIEQEFAQERWMTERMVTS